MVLLDDILDEGVTLAALKAWCLEEGARAVTSVVLLEKAQDGAHRADFAALSCPDRYVFGYGMDYKGYWRNAPGIYAVAESTDNNQDR